MHSTCYDILKAKQDRKAELNNNKQSQHAGLHYYNQDSTMHNNNTTCKTIQWKEMQEN
jgi:hypothetical protein